MSRLLLASLSLGLITAAALLSRSSPESADKPRTESALRAVGALHPRVAPSGDRIAFPYQGAIWVMPAAGGAMMRLTDGDGFDIEPAWSADGKRIACINTRNFVSGPLHIINADDGKILDSP